MFLSIVPQTRALMDVHARAYGRHAQHAAAAHQPALRQFKLSDERMLLPYGLKQLLFLGIAVMFTGASATKLIEVGCVQAAFRCPNAVPTQGNGGPPHLARARRRKA